MLQRTAAVVGAAGLLALEGCALEEPQDRVGSRTQALDAGGIDSTRAALAVAVAMELGTLDPVSQFTIVESRVRLTPERQAWCDAFGDGCPLVNDILSFQEDYWLRLVTQEKLNPTALRSQMRSDLQLQVHWEQSLAQNDPGRLPPPHVLAHVDTVDLGGLGLHYVFDAYGQGCQLGEPPEYTVLYQVKNTDPKDNQGQFGVRIQAGSKPVDTRGITLRYAFVAEPSQWNPTVTMAAECWGSTRGCPKLTAKAGYLDIAFDAGIILAGSAVEATVALHLSDWHPMDESNDPSFNPRLTSWGVNPYLIEVTDKECVPFANTEALEERTKFFGGSSNPYLDIRVDGSQIAIDPDRGDTTDATGTSGTCTVAKKCNLRDPDWSSVGDCCICDGKYGTWQVVPWNTARVYCK